MSLKPKTKRKKSVNDSRISTVISEYSNVRGIYERKLSGTDVEKKRIKYILDTYPTMFRAKDYHDYEVYRGMPYIIPIDNKDIGETNVSVHRETGYSNERDAFVVVRSPTKFSKGDNHVRYITRERMSKSNALKLMSKIAKGLKEIN